MEIGTNTELNKFGVERFQAAQQTEDELGQREFLQLIVAQIQNQDPFEPVENGEFIGQLAQFGTVDGVNRLNDSFSQLASSIQTNQTLGATSLIGKSVIVEGNQVNLKEDSSVEAFVDAQGFVGVSNVQIKDAGGQVVRTIPVSLVDPDLNSFEWDGRNENGQQVPAGEYFISASIQSGVDEISLSTSVKSEVQSVNVSGLNSVELGLESGNSIPFNEIENILK